MAVASRRTGKYGNSESVYTEDAVGEITRRINDEIANTIDKLISRTIISKLRSNERKSKS